ncbi:hypothetical protein GCM10029964_121820 [Kibdelosporangium lantanae]
MAPLVIIDAANVVGSVPDGWWKDRHGATERLRDRLADLPTQRLGTLDPPLDVVMVVEGRARNVAASDTIRVVAAPPPATTPSSTWSVPPRTVRSWSSPRTAASVPG